MELASRVAELVEPLVARSGLDLFDVEQDGGTLRVLVDRDGGVDLETLGELTRAVSRLLDQEDPVPGRYTLEVSSPGLERTLRRPAHFSGAVGREVTVKVVEPIDGQHRIDGVLEAADDGGITVDGRTIPYELIAKARTVFRWGSEPKPGKGPSRRASGTSQKRATR